MPWLNTFIKQRQTTFMAKISINNANIYYELHGSGEPLVLISGYGCDHLYWAGFLPYLAEHFRVLLFDNRAIGQTTDQGIPLSAELMADDVMSLCHVLKLKKPNIVGQSMGGTIAQAVGYRHPDKISKLVLMCTTSKWRQAIKNAFKSMLIMREENVSFDILCDQLNAWVYGEKFLQDTKSLELVKQYLLQMPYPQSVENQRRHFMVMENFDATNALEKITANTLVCYGREDIISLPYESQFLAESITTSTIAALDCAHGVAMEAPKRAANILIDFLM